MHTLPVSPCCIDDVLNNCTPYGVWIFLLAVLYRYNIEIHSADCFLQAGLNVTVFCLGLAVTATRAQVIGGVHDTCWFSPGSEVIMMSMTNWIEYSCCYVLLCYYC